MKRRIPLLIILGICLIIFSLCFTVIVQIRMHKGTQNSQMAVSKMSELLPDRTPGIWGIYSNPSMPILEIDGVDYVAMLEIPSFDIVLPVADKWDNKKLSQSPVRFCGSAYDHTLVIGGADHSGQFDFCDKIEHGTLITITDMTGAQFTYTVSGVDRAKHAELPWLTDSDCDLTLFCHDTYSMEYIAVRCVSAYN